MRKVFFGFAAISLIMLATSCSNETVEVNTDLGNVLAFKAATGKQTLTRASEANLLTLEGVGLLVESFKVDGSPYKEYTINWGGSGWSYGPPEYHPLTYNLYHYSVYPSDVDMTNASGEVTLDNYTVGATAGDQVDLMVADDITTPTDGTANLTYKHILSQVNFAIQGMENLIVEISKIKLTNINSTSTYTFGTGWGTRTLPVNYDYNPVGGSAITPGDENDEILYLGNTGDGPDEVDRNNSNTNALMLLPQTLDPTAELTFSYKLYNKATPPVEFDSDDVTVILDQLGVDEWIQGKRYLYKLIFDPVLLEFEVEVEESWIDYNHPGGGIINVDTTN